MRNLIAFLQRFRVFLVFLLLQLFALGTYFYWVSYPRTRFLNTSNQIVGTFLTWQRDVTKHLYLDKENKKLMEQMAELKEKLPMAFVAIDSSVVKIEDTLHKKSFELIPATVTNSSFSKTNNFFTINAGRLKGVQPKMGVMTNDGAVGIVYDVSDHYAVVKSILTEDINISASVEHNKAHGIIKYLDKDPQRVTLTGISNDIKIKKHAEVNARGSGGYFPPGTPIGIVEKLEPIEGRPLWDITVRLHQDMRRLHYVYVIKHIFKQELENLEAAIEEKN
jgi:rod shape-determining protein MreC